MTVHPVATADLYAEYGEALQSCDRQFRQFGGRALFSRGLGSGRRTAHSLVPTRRESSAGIACAYCGAARKQYRFTLNR